MKLTVDLMFSSALKCKKFSLLKDGRPFNMSPAYERNGNSESD